MKITSTILLAMLAAAANSAQAQIVNFHYAHNYAAGAPGYADIVYVGQGAYSDPGNNTWNGYGLGHPGATGPNFTSDGIATPVTLTISSGVGANGGIYLSGNGTTNPNQGTPFFLLGYAQLVNSANPGVGTSGAPQGAFTLHNVPAGAIYSLYLYGANYDSDRGAVFTLDPTNAGVAHNGNNGTDNNGSNTTFVEGANFVYFENVVPDVNGDIKGMWAPNPNSTLTGEGNFNGLQLVKIIPEPSTCAALLGSVGVLLLGRRRRTEPA